MAMGDNELLHGFEHSDVCNLQPRVRVRIPDPKLSVIAAVTALGVGETIRDFSNMPIVFKKDTNISCDDGVVTFKGFLDDDVVGIILGFVRDGLGPELGDVAVDILEDELERKKEHCQFWLTKDCIVDALKKIGGARAKAIVDKIEQQKTQEWEEAHKGETYDHLDFPPGYGSLP